MKLQDKHKQRQTEMLAQTQARLKEMKRASNEYLDDLLKRTEDSITTSLNEFKNKHARISRLLCVPDSKEHLKINKT